MSKNEDEFGKSFSRWWKKRGLFFMGEPSPETKQQWKDAHSKAYDQAMFARGLVHEIKIYYWEHPDDIGCLTNWDDELKKLPRTPPELTKDGRLVK